MQVRAPFIFIELQLSLLVKYYEQEAPMELQISGQKDRNSRFPELQQLNKTEWIYYLINAIWSKNKNAIFPWESEVNPVRIIAQELIFRQTKLATITTIIKGNRLIKSMQILKTKRLLEISESWRMLR